MTQEITPLFFFGHGSPMNAIEENSYVKTFRKEGKNIQKPQSVVVISAHWETQGTFVTGTEYPRTIHDFGGFPEVLYHLKYGAKGNPKLAQQITKILKKYNVKLDTSWGFDHGNWAVLRHFFPNADVPVIQLSLDITQPPAYHLELANALKSLRKEGVMFIGSGNIIHNLKMVDWSKLDENFAFPWALEVSSQIKKWIKDLDIQKLTNSKNFEREDFALAIPTMEHFLPVIYITALAEKSENIRFFNDEMTGGSLSMTSFKISNT